MDYDEELLSLSLNPTLTGFVILSIKKLKIALNYWSLNPTLTGFVILSFFVMLEHDNLYVLILL
mgnify:FL=1